MLIVTPDLNQNNRQSETIFNLLYRISSRKGAGFLYNVIPPFGRVNFV